jgi:hypothetical protein
MNPIEDPEIAWIRSVRMRISEQFNHDPELLIKHYMELQRHHRDRLVYSTVTVGGEQPTQAPAETTRTG